MNVGVGQTGDTCWFNSSLNIFLTSDAGLKILWKKLRLVYSRLGVENKKKFNSNARVPCAYRNLTKTPQINFWRFLNQYICAVGGPGSLLPKSGLNAYLTKNIKWKNAGLRESKGTSGGWPNVELAPLLKHLGFKEGPEFRIISDERWRYKFKNARWSTPILIFRGRAINEFYIGIEKRNIVPSKQGYDLTGAIVYVKPSENSQLDPHVWACSIRNGKGYITDSNYPTSPVECKWWLQDSLDRYFGTVAANYRPNRSRQMVFDAIMYTRKSYTDAIAPFCLLPKTYRPLTNENKAEVGRFEAIFGPKSTPTTYMRNKFAPRIVAEAIRVNANKPVINANMYNSIITNATSFNNGLAAVNRMIRAGMKANTNGPNFRNFRRKLAAKFPKPVQRNMFKYFWQNAVSNSEFVKRLRLFAERTGQTVNEAQIQGILKTRAKTRAGAKRVHNATEERMYLVNGRDWFNNRGNNVTNKINSANWVQTNNNNITPFVKSHTMARNVRTFKRRVANFNEARAKAARRR
jgi:hypothetical protein